MSQLVTPEFFRGLKRDATTAFQYNTKNLSNEAPQPKRIKLEEQEALLTEDLPINVENTAVTDLSIFSNLPSELIDCHIILFLPIDWLYVSKHHYNIAMKNIDRDPRIKWDENSLNRAVMADNLHIMTMHLELNFLTSIEIMQNLFMRAVNYKSIKIVQHFVSEDTLIRGGSPLVPDYYSNALFTSISYKCPDMVKILACSGHIKNEVVEANAYLERAVDTNQPDIAQILIANGLYSTEGILEVITRLFPQNNVCLVQILFRAIDFQLTNDQLMDLLTSAICTGANDIVKYLLDEYLGHFEEFTEECIHGAISRCNTKLVEFLLSDKRFKVTEESLRRVTFVDSTEILKLLRQDPRLQSVSNTRNVLKTAADYRAVRIICKLLDELDPEIDVTSIVDADLLQDSIQYHPDNDTHIVLTLLDHPRVNFDLSAGLAVAIALQHNCYYVAETILNDKRFVVMEETYYQIAMEWATKNYKTHIIQRLQEVKRCSKLSAPPKK